MENGELGLGTRGSGVGGALAVDVVADLGRQEMLVEGRKRREGGENGVVPFFQVGGGVDEEDAPAAEHAKAAAGAAERLFADVQPDLFCDGQERVESCLQVHGQVHLANCR